ncbi:DUF3857 domain-containing protein, partial [Algoriella sp.]|uniref:DUF3857 domain-containing protein n=1 Tax=Algoriella sp. TaxID=1872434 RepID=UPI001B0C535C
KDADAVILDEEGYINITGNDYYIDVKKRVKILTEKGKNKANIEIEYFSDNNLQNISNIKGQTINQENGQFVNYTIDDKEVFTVKTNQYYSAKRITFPNVKVGSIIEYQYRMTGNHLYLIDAWDFQHELPTIKSFFKAEVTGYLDYTNLLVGKKMVEKYSKNSKNEWVLTNIPSYKDIKYVNNIEDNSERIRLQLKGYYGNGGSIFGNDSEYKTTIQTWKDLKKEITTANNNFVNEGYVSKIAEQIPNGGTELETLKNVITYFNSNFKWNRFRAIFLRETQKNIIENKTGNLADLNKLFQTILKAKNIKSDLLLVSTRDNGKLITNFPYLNQFDAMINLVKLKDNTTYLINSATISEDQFIYPSLNIFNDYAFNIDEKEDVFLDIKPTLSSYESNITYSIQENFITQNRKEMFNGYFYNEYFEDKNELIDQYLTPAIGRFYDDQNKMNLFFDKTDEKYKIMKIGKASLNEKENFIPIENPLKKHLETYTFDEKDRKFPIEFNFPYYFTVNVKVKVPENYELVSPSDFTKTIKLNENLVYYQNAVYKDGTLNIIYQLLVNKSVFEAKDYNLLKTFFESTQKLAQDQFILKKK